MSLRLSSLAGAEKVLGEGHLCQAFTGGGRWGAVDVYERMKNSVRGADKP